MDAEETASVFAVGAGFFAEAGGVAGVEERELVFVEDFVHVVAGEGHFGGGDESEVFAFDVIFVGLVARSGVETATFEDFAGDEVGDGHEGEAVFKDFFKAELKQGVF